LDLSPFLPFSSTLFFNADYVEIANAKHPNCALNMGTLFKMSPDAKTQGRCNSQDNRFYQTTPPP